MMVPGFILILIWPKILNCGYTGGRAQKWGDVQYSNRLTGFQILKFDFDFNLHEISKLRHVWRRAPNWKIQSIFQQMMNIVNSETSDWRTDRIIFVRDSAILKLTKCLFIDLKEGIWSAHFYLGLVLVSKMNEVHVILSNSPVSIPSPYYLSKIF